MTVYPGGERWLPSVTALMAVLSGCTSFQILSPAQNAIIGGPTTTVEVDANPEMSQLSVSLDQTDITSKMYSQPTVSTGQVNVTPGPHTLAATAIVGINDPYTWPTPFHATDSKQFCSTQPRPAASTVTPFTFAGSDTWVNGSSGVSLGPDRTDGSTRWWLGNALPNSTQNHSGQIKWGGAPDCKCISSDGVLHGAPPMSSCDPTIGANLNPTDSQKLQLWDSIFAKSMGNVKFYFFGNLNTNLCLSEKAGQLTQENCDSTFTDTNQLWRLRDNSTGMLSNNPNPWTIDP